MQQPRLEGKVARLMVKWKPGDVDRTLGDGKFVARIPPALAVVVDHDVVRLRRYLVFLDNLRAVIDIHTVVAQWLAEFVDERSYGMWHVSSRSGEACCELLYSVYLLLTVGLKVTQTGSNVAANICLDITRYNSF